eukprot:g1519.t1
MASFWDEFTMEVVLTHLRNNICLLILFFVVDQLLIRRFVTSRCTKHRDISTARWFFCHAFANFLVVCTAIPGMWEILRDPLNALNADKHPDRSMFGSGSPYPLTIVSTVHVYHMIGGFSLTGADYFHHFMFIPTLAFPGQVFKWGALGNWQAFFLSGFPGGVDYFLLGLVKCNLFDRMREKRWSSNLNCWCRSPGTIICNVLLYIGIQNGHYVGNVPLWAVALQVVLPPFNAIYYSKDFYPRGHRISHFQTGSSKNYEQDLYTNDNSISHIVREQIASRKNPSLRSHDEMSNVSSSPEKLQEWFSQHVRKIEFMLAHTIHLLRAGIEYSNDISQKCREVIRRRLSYLSSFFRKWLDFKINELEKIRNSNVSTIEKWINKTKEEIENFERKITMQTNKVRIVIQETERVMDEIAVDALSKGCYCVKEKSRIAVTTELKDSIEAKSTANTKEFGEIMKKTEREHFLLKDSVESNTSEGKSSSRRQREEKASKSSIKASAPVTTTATPTSIVPCIDKDEQNATLQHSNDISRAMVLNSASSEYNCFANTMNFIFGRLRIENLKIHDCIASGASSVSFTDFVNGFKLLIAKYRKEATEVLLIETSSSNQNNGALSEEKSIKIAKQICLIGNGEKKEVDMNRLEAMLAAIGLDTYNDVRSAAIGVFEYVDQDRDGHITFKELADFISSVCRLTCLVAFVNNENYFSELEKSKKMIAVGNEVAAVCFHARRNEPVSLLTYSVFHVGQFSRLFDASVETNCGINLGKELFAKRRESKTTFLKVNHLNIFLRNKRKEN